MGGRSVVGSTPSTGSRPVRHALTPSTPDPEKSHFCYHNFYIRALSNGITLPLIKTLPPDGVRCPACGGATVIRHGRDDAQEQRQRYRCSECRARFDDLTGTVLAGHHQPLRVWVLCLYLMGLNLSNRQIARELDLGETDVQAMAEQLRYGLAVKRPPARLAGEVEIDEVYVVAGHKGNPAAVAKGGVPVDAGG
jgi:transposase-like protein